MTLPDAEMAYLQAAMSTIDLVPPEHRKRSQEYFDFAIKFMTQPEDAKEYKGYYFPPGFEPDTARYGYDKFQIKSGDVLVADHARGGSAWVIEILNHIFGRKDPELLEKHSKVTQLFGYLEFGPVSTYEITERLPMKNRVLGTHLPASLVNLKKFKENGAKVIYVLRNPKDQAVAWYNYAMMFSYLQADNWKDIIPRDERKFYDLYLAGKQLLFAKKDEGYLEIIREWYKHKDDKHVLFMAYEEIVKDLRGEINKVAQFVGESLSEKELDWIVEKTTLSSMKENADESGSKPRKGEVGDWKDHLTVSQSELIDQKVERILGDTDITFIYE